MLNNDDNGYNLDRMPTINNSGYKVLLTISMIYMSIMLCNAILTNRYVGVDSFFILGGTLTSPFIFIIDGIIAEIYGYEIARCLILSGFAAQTLFVVICQFILITPYPFHLKEFGSYVQILGPSLLRINISSFVAYIVANLVNAYIISKWKILLKGKKFWLRSLCSSIFSEALYSFIAILMMELNTLSLHDIFKVVIISYIIKATYSIIFAGPANIFVNFIKKITGIDVYDFNINYTPFKLLEENRT